jgi:hypothetical protein
VLATVVAQLAGAGELAVVAALADTPTLALVAGGLAALCVAVADPQPASAPMVNSTDRSRPSRRLPFGPYAVLGGRRTTLSLRL